MSVADGNETVIEPPQTDGPNGPAQWYPYSVTWSPDGTTLLYTAWNEGGGGGTITVPADSPTDVTVLSDVIGWGVGDDYSHRWVPVQRWGRQPFVADADEDGTGPVASVPAAVPATMPSDLQNAAPPDVPAEVTELLLGFLEARVAGNGAQQYLSAPDQDIPLLYSTTSGVPYDRAEFERAPSIGWPYGWTAYTVRLFAGDTVVEQLFFTPAAGRLGLEYQPDGFGTDIAPTIEDGRPVAVRYDLFDGDVTLQIAHPWIFSDGIPFGRLIPEGTGVNPTTDGGERNDWSEFFLQANPAHRSMGTDCRSGPSPVDAETLAQTIRSDPDLEATAPLALSVGGVQALKMDVAIAETANLCELVPTARGTVSQGRNVAGVPLATGDRMRLYLFDTPEGSSMRILAISIVAPESRFETAVRAAEPIVATVEFRSP